MFGRSFIAAMVWLVALVPGNAQDAAWKTPSDEAVRKILVDRIDVERRGVGIVVGIVDANGRRIISHGVSTRGDPRTPDGDTAFEIGSITKVFTGLLLADMVQRGEVALDQPVASLMPPGTSLPERNGRQITLIDLATHTSALPRLPDNLTPKVPGNPFADYSIEQMYAFLRRVELGARSARPMSIRIWVSACLARCWPVASAATMRRF